MKNSKEIEKSITIKSTLPKVWDVLTNPKFAKILGNELDKGAFLESDWKLGSKVYFKYEPDKTVATGIITECVEYSRMFTAYKEINYFDSYTLSQIDGDILLHIHSGPYPDDYEEQLEVWDKWLNKVKELSES